MKVELSKGQIVNDQHHSRASIRILSFQLSQLARDYERLATNMTTGSSSLNELAMLEIRTTMVELEADIDLFKQII